MPKKKYYDGGMSSGDHAGVPTDSYVKYYPGNEYVNTQPYGDTGEFNQMETNKDVAKTRKMPSKRRG